LWSPTRSSAASVLPSYQPQTVVRGNNRTFGSSRSSERIVSAVSAPSAPDQFPEPPKHGIGLAQHDLFAIGGGLARRFQPGGTGTDDEHVAKGVHALVAGGIGRAGRAETGGAANEMLAEHPDACALQRADDRAHEGLVVEAGAERLSGQLVGRHHVEGKRRIAVLASATRPL
jgi:hypothetical protein